MRYNRYASIILLPIGKGAIKIMPNPQGIVKKSFHLILLFISVLLVLSGCQKKHKKKEKYPNIIYILADDLGYGDISCYNDSSKIFTPNVDKLAKEGMMFTDAHSGSAVCTPTRYGILTGRYAWRTRLKNGVLWGHDAHLIKKEKTTVASFLKKHDYQTACIGKWHLGLDFAKDSLDRYDYLQPVLNGPNSLGFDYSFIIPASLDIPPYLYIENGMTTGTSIDTIAGKSGKMFWRKGLCANDFKHIDVLPILNKKANEAIAKYAKSENPFFLYFPLPAPHTPILPTDEFLGKSNTNEYGDFVLMVDDVIKKIEESLKENGIEENTIIIFTSDNGCSPMADFAELKEIGHNPNYVYRGHKADIYEGGHRVPFIVKWPKQIKEGRQSDEIICTTDLLATCAAIIGDSLKSNEGEDSYNNLPIWLELEQNIEKREAIVHHSVDGYFSIRKGKWKLEFCPGSGGWSYPRPAKAKELGLFPVQLYDLETDIKEENNVAESYPGLVKEMTELMQKYIDDGRSTSGDHQQNEGSTELIKS